MANIFAYRATDPKVMLAQLDPIGPENDVLLLKQAADASMIICAWGNLGKFKGRGENVMYVLDEYKAKLRYLALSPLTGQPKHPLYLSARMTPKPF